MEATANIHKAIRELLSTVKKKVVSGSVTGDFIFDLESGTILKIVAVRTGTLFTPTWDFTDMRVSNYKFKLLKCLCLRSR